MSERPSPPAEATLIATAQKSSRLSNRKAAKKAGMSEGRWRQIIQGYQTVSGVHVPVSAPAETLARMAQVVGATPDQLVEAGRDDAAEALDARSPIDGPQSDDSSTVAQLETRVARLEQELAERERAQRSDYPEDPLIRLIEGDTEHLSRDQLSHYVDRLTQIRDHLAQQLDEKERQPNGR